jgi:hypothetical protein
MNYNEKMKLDTWSKQTQTKPILSRVQPRDLSKQLPATPSDVVFSYVLNFAGTSRPWSVISLESDIIFIKKHLTQ